MASAVYFLVSIALIVSLFLVQVENSKMTVYEISPPAGKGLGFRQILFGALKPPTGVQIGFRTIRISSELPSVTLLAPNEHVKALDEDVLFTITEDGLLKCRFPNFAENLLLINHDEKRRLSNLQPQNDENVCLAAYELKGNAEFCYLRANKDFSRTDLDKFLKDGILTAKTFKLFSKETPIQFIKVTVGHKQTSHSTLNSKLPLDGFLASQRWFSAFKAAHYQEILNLTSGLAGWPYMFNFSGLSPIFNVFRWHLKNENFGMIMGNNIVVLSERLSLGHGQDDSFNIQELNPYLLVALYVPGKLIMSMEGTVPFSSAIYRNGKLVANISSPGSTETLIEENDMVVIWPWDMCRTGNSEWRDPFSKSTHYQSDTPGLKDFAKRLFCSKEVSIKIAKSSESMDYKVVPRPYVLWLPGKGSNDELQFLQFDWYSANLDYPTSLLLNEHAVYFGGPFEVFPTQYLNKGIQTKEVEEIFTKGAGVRFALKLDGRKREVQYTVLLNRRGDNSSRYYLLLSRKGKTIYLDKREGDTIGFSCVEEGDTLEVYNVKDIDRDPLVLPFMSAGNSESHIDKSCLCEASVSALVVHIGKVEKPKRKVDRDNLVTNTVRMIHWLSVVDDIGLVKPSLKNDNKNTHDWTLQWYQVGNQDLVWAVSYSLFGLHISDKDVIISSDRRKLRLVGKLDANQIATLKLDPHDGAMTIDCDGIVPFTWALYRGKNLVISWSGKGTYKFDDTEPGDILALIPWTAFSRDRNLNVVEEIAKDSSSFLTALSDGFSKGDFLAARILYRKPRDKSLFDKFVKKRSEIRGLSED